MSCGDRSGAGVSGWSVQIVVREPEEGTRQPRCGDIGCNRAADYPRGTPMMLGPGATAVSGRTPAGTGALVLYWSDSVRCP